MPSDAGGAAVGVRFCPTEPVLPLLALHPAITIKLVSNAIELAMYVVLIIESCSSLRDYLKDGLKVSNSVSTLFTRNTTRRF